jgi:hypothetical protein
MPPPPHSDSFLMSTLQKKHSANPGWILVTVVMTLCILGTWLTVRNYRSHVFSSSEGTVLENQWPESRISVTLSENQAKQVQPGHAAKITLHGDNRLLTGKVVSVTPDNSGSDTVIIRLTSNPGNAGTPPEKNDGTGSDYLTPRTECSVTIDTTVPPNEKSNP